MKFINRNVERARLSALMKHPTASVIVIWGRRRVGKSRLLREWISKHKGVYYMADESAATIQRKYFALTIEESLPGFSEAEYPDWTAFFARIGRDALQKKWRGPLIIDELPYLITVSPEFPSVLQKFIDNDAKQAKLILALCGSSQQVMQGVVLDASAPLYGRADEILKLSPIPIDYLGGALKIKAPRSIIESYSVWGGIPRYWELVERTQGSFFEKIDKLVCDPMGTLTDEPNRLLLEESSLHLRPILDAIGMGIHRLSEIAARIGQPVTSLMRPIQRLIELDLIQREHPFGEHENNSKRTLYKTKDPFLRFWFHVVASKRSFLSQAPSSVRIKWLKQALSFPVSNTWEELCRLAVPHLSKYWGEDFYGPAGRFWQGQGPEWDILAKSEDGRTLLIGEAKWTLKPPSAQFVQQVLQEIKAKGIPPISRHPQSKLIYALFVPEKPKNLSLPSDTKIIDAKEVIAALK